LREPISWVCTANPSTWSTLRAQLYATKPCVSTLHICVVGTRSPQLSSASAKVTDPTARLTSDRTKQCKASHKPGLLHFTSPLPIGRASPPTPFPQLPLARLHQSARWSRLCLSISWPLPTPRMQSAAHTASSAPSLPLLSSHNPVQHSLTGSMAVSFSLRESMNSWLPSPFPSRLHACSPQPTITTPVPSLPIYKSHKSSSDTLSQGAGPSLSPSARVFISSLPLLHSPSPRQQHPLSLLPQSSSPNSQNLNPLPPITTAGPHFSGLYNK